MSNSRHSASPCIADSATAILYYEAHVTIEPVFDVRLNEARLIAARYKFRLADLLMKKRSEDTEERSKHDTFMTGHGKEYQDIRDRLIGLILALKETEFKVWLYKIEDTVLDSRVQDVFSLVQVGSDAAA